MQLPIYLDYMATTPVDLRVKAKMIACLSVDGNFGNAASTSHVYGHRALEAIDQAREQVAKLINADAKEIIWTSGATEADNLAIKGAANFYARKGKHIITCKSEHKAVLDSCAYLENKGFEVTYLQPEKNGLLDLNKLKQAIRPDTILVSIMQVNNEIGVIQDIAAISKIVKPQGILLHVDAAQSAGKIVIDLQKMHIDLMSFSAHKIYGPKGIGALYVKRNPRVRLEPLIHGGGHEFGLRSGTLATHQIVGMGAAFAIANEELVTESKRLLDLRERFWQGINVLSNIYINGDIENRIPGILNVSFADVDGETLVLRLKDLAVSSGAACTSATHEPSYVLRAIGVENNLAQSAIRFSFGRFTTIEEIDYAIVHVVDVVTKLRKGNVVARHEYKRGWKNNE